jgi:hypothetical protein
MTEVGEKLTSLIIQVLNAARDPLSPRKIAEAILRIKQDVVPQPIYDPHKTYQRGQRLYHASSKCQEWFVVQDVQGNALIAQFDDGRCMKLVHGGGLEQHLAFPMSAEAYLAAKVEELLPSIPGLYQQNGLWFNRPIRQEAVARHKLDRPTDMQSQFSTLVPKRSTAHPASTVRACLATAQETLEATLRKYQIDCFYHITYIKNLPGILKEGLLCHNKVKEYHDISNLEIQETRHYKRIPLYPKLTLHDCVPLFVAPKPPMLSALREKQSEIIYLHIDPQVLTLSQVVFTDGNARSNATRFYNRLDDLRHLDWEILWAHYWGSDDPAKHQENKRRRSAEVLIPGCIPSPYVQCITVMTPDTRLRALKIVKEAKKEIRVTIDTGMYYPIPSQASTSRIGQ